MTPIRTKSNTPPTVCPMKRCGGALFNTSPRLATALGVMHLRCDKCGAQFAFTPRKEGREAA